MCDMTDEVMQMYICNCLSCNAAYEVNMARETMESTCNASTAYLLDNGVGVGLYSMLPRRTECLRRERCQGENEFVGYGMSAAAISRL